MQTPITLLYFAWLRERTGASEETFTLPPDVRTIGALIDVLRARGPGFASAFETPNLVRAAVNQVFARPETAVAPGDEVAFFPPVTGG
jgi:molybdopterin synthase sulfur carrier subunit